MKRSTLCRQFALFLLLILTPALAHAATVSGQVSDATSGAPVEGALMSAFSFDPATGDSVLYTTLTDVSGNYQLGNLPEGFYFFSAEKENYTPEFQGPIQLGPNAQVTLDYSLFALQAVNNFLAGRVIDSQTLFPVSRATLFLASQAGFAYNAFSDSSGSFRFENIQPGQYQLSANAPGYLPYMDNSLIQIDQNSEIVVGDILLTPGQGGGNGVLEGIVLDATIFIPVESGTVRAVGFTATGDSIVLSTAIEHGFYSFPQIPAGIYDVTASAPNYESNTVAGYLVDPAGSFLEFLLTPSGTPVGNAVLSGLVSDSSGAGIANAGIQVAGTDSSGFPLNYFGRTGQDGNYLITGIVDGIYDVSAFAATFAAQTVAGVAISENAPAVLNFALLPDGTASLTGTVSDSATGLPVPAFISLTAADSNHIEFIPNDPVTGVYLIEGLPEGVYTVSCVNLQTGIELQVPGFIINSGVNTLDFVFGESIPNAGSISGTVVFDSSGAPVAQAIVEFIGTSGGHFNQSVVTDPNGNYTAELSAGGYIVAVHYYNPNFPIPYTEYYDDVQSIGSATPVTIVEGGITSGIDFGIPENGGSGFDVQISGRVTDSGGISLAGAVVTIRSLFNDPIFGDSTVYSAITDAQGSYQIDITNGNPFDFYMASAARPGYLTEWWQEKPDMFSADPLFLFCDSTLQDIDFTLSPDNGGGGNNNSISGVVTNLLGVPLNNAFVIASSLGSNRLSFAFSDSSGSYTLGGLENAPHIVLFSRDGHIPEFYDDATIWENAIPVPALGDVTGIDAQLAAFNQNPAGGMIAGTVEDVTGSVLSGVLVSVRNSFGEVMGFAFTDAQGSYQLHGMMDGDYTVQATKIAFSSESIPVLYNSNNGTTMLLDIDLAGVTVGVEPIEQASVPEIMELQQNYPNPFNPTTSIRFALPGAQQVRLAVYNVLGQPVRELVNDNLAAGRYELSWNGTDESGRKVASGIYFYSLETGGSRLVRKMLFNK